MVGKESRHALNRAFNKSIAAAAEAFERERELEALQRRREYLSFVMHDLKTPLSAIMVAAQVVEERPDDAKMVAEMARIITQGGAQLDELLLKTIMVGKNGIEENIEDFVPRTFELWPVVQSVISEFRLVAAEGHTTVQNLVSSNLLIYADAVALTAIVRNLLSNAIKYNLGGTVAVGAAASHEAQNQRDVVEFWVRDTGEGIPPERLAHIFKKVDPDPRKKDSSGIGLFMAKKLVEAHNGTITVERSVREGSTFRVVLPAAQG